jgi:hypothetical protein
MPSINLSFLKLLKTDINKFSIFVETGTYTGDTIFEMEKYFNELHTIELSDYYYQLTKNRYNGNKIKFYLGDSSKILTVLLPKLKEPTIFFLDGHWSSGNTAKGNKDCPLIEEINNINKYFLNDGIIIIDDCRLFGKSPKTGHNEDWSEISEETILNIIKNRISSYYYLDSEICKDDRLIIHINKFNI